MGHLVLYCQPGAPATRIAGEHGGMPKVQLKARPVDGEANAALIAFVASHLGITRASVSLVQGGASRIKRIEVQAFSDEALKEAFQGTLR
jgi:uncharacterized protein YggU (UPF0235/DUF167 family)